MTVKVTLSPREIKILRMVARGKTDKEIAQTLGMMLRTVKYYTTKLHYKLTPNDSMNTRVELVIWCYENGFVKPGVKDR
jgi:DNA-binding NarL/FixJ family response regulator